MLEDHEKTVLKNSTLALTIRNQRSFIASFISIIGKFVLYWLMWNNNIKLALKSWLWTHYGLRITDQLFKSNVFTRVVRWQSTFQCHFWPEIEMNTRYNRLRTQRLRWLGHVVRMDEGSVQDVDDVWNRREKEKR
jgi:hypothetical protein